MTTLSNSVRARIVRPAVELHDNFTLEDPSILYPTCRVSRVDIPDRGYGAVFNSTQSRIACACGDSIGRVIDTMTGGVAFEMVGHGKEILSIDYSANDASIVTGSSDCSFAVWNGESGDLVSHQRDGHTGPVLCVTISPDSSMCATACKDARVRIWDLDTLQLVDDYQGHRDAVLSVQYSPAGSILASASEDNTVRCWDVRSGRQIAEFGDHGISMRSVAFSPCGSSLAAAGYHYEDASIRVWDMRQRKLRRKLSYPGHTSEYFVQSLAYAAGGSILASGSRDGGVTFWNADASDRPLCTLSCSDAPIWSVSYGPSADILAVSCLDNSIRLLDTSCLSVAYLGDRDQTTESPVMATMRLSFDDDSDSCDEPSSALEPTPFRAEVEPSRRRRVSRRSSCQRLLSTVSSVNADGDSRIVANIGGGDVVHNAFRIQTLRRLLVQNMDVGSIDLSQVECFALKVLVLRRCMLSTLQLVPDVLSSVVVLDLSMNALDGVPSSLEFMSSLEVLSMRQCGLHLLPGTIFDIPTLRYCDVSENCLSMLPNSGWHRAQQLCHFDCHGNLLRTLPEDIRECGKLVTLDVSANSLAALEDCIFALPSLKYLVANDNQVDDVLVPRPAQSPLELVNLENNRLRQIPIELGALLPHLVHVQLSGNPLTTPFCDIVGCEGKVMEYIRSQYETHDRMHSANVRELHGLDPMRWSVDHVSSWLSEVEFGKYSAVFSSNDIDGEELLHMTDDVLRNRLHISSVGHISKLMRTIDGLKMPGGSDGSVSELPGSPPALGSVVGSSETTRLSTPLSSDSSRPHSLLHRRMSFRSGSDGSPGSPAWSDRSPLSPISTGSILEDRCNISSSVSVSSDLLSRSTADLLMTDQKEDGCYRAGIGEQYCLLVTLSGLEDGSLIDGGCCGVELKSIHYHEKKTISQSMDLQGVSLPYKHVPSETKSVMVWMDIPGLANHLRLIHPSSKIPELLCEKSMDGTRFRFMLQVRYASTSHTNRTFFVDTQVTFKLYDPTVAILSPQMSFEEFCSNFDAKGYIENAELLIPLRRDGIEVSYAVRDETRDRKLDYVGKKNDGTFRLHCNHAYILTVLQPRPADSRHNLTIRSIDSVSLVDIRHGDKDPISVCLSIPPGAEHDDTRNVFPIPLEFADIGYGVDVWLNMRSLSTTWSKHLNHVLPNPFCTSHKRHERILLDIRMRFECEGKEHYLFEIPVAVKLKLYPETEHWTYAHGIGRLPSFKDIRSRHPTTRAVTRSECVTKMIKHSIRFIPRKDVDELAGEH